MTKQLTQDFIVLFVDDEANILNALKRMFRHEPYRCEYASSGLDALAIMQKHDVGVVVADMRMPGMDGLKLLREIKERHPHTVRMVLSGYTQVPQILAVVNQVEIFKFIPKPWETEGDLLSGVREGIAAYQRYKDEQLEKSQAEETHARLNDILRLAKERLDLYLREIANLSAVSSAVVEQAGQFINAVSQSDAQLVANLWQAYVDTIPTRTTVFSTERLYRELRYVLSHPTKHLANITASATECNITGNYALLFALICALIQQASAPPQHIPQLAITQAVSAEGVTLTFVLADIDPASISLLKQAEALLGEIASTMRGSFAIHDDSTACLKATFFPTEEVRGQNL
ncbi:MAG: response regulator receiver [Bacillota bacterium]|nr:MAG: response regulator receiver [Bacillota bacterium]